jgi:hypothetical protein
MCDNFKVFFPYPMCLTCLLDIMCGDDCKKRTDYDNLKILDKKISKIKKISF